MGSGAGGCTGAGAITAGEFTAGGPGAAEFVVDLFAACGEGFGESELGGDVATLDEGTELSAAALTGLAVDGFGAFAGAGSEAATASVSGSIFFSGSFFFGTAEITIDTTWSFCTSAKP
jgi:hypothetical protein